MVHSKQQLIKFLEQNVTDRVLQNALSRGRIEFLGGFNSLFCDLPGFIIQLTSYHNMTYNIGIIENVDGKLQWFRLLKVPWQNWDGDKSNDKLYQGDNPEKYSELKNENQRVN